MIGVLVAAMLAAPGSGRVWAHSERCPPGFETELRRLLTIELKTPIVDAPANGDSSVQVRCVGDRYRVVLAAPQHVPEEIDVDVTELSPLAIPRAVTLVVAEALTRLWRSPATLELPVEQPKPPEVVAPIPVPVPTSEGERRFELSLQGGGRFAALPLFGGGLALDVTVVPWFGVRIDVAALRGGVDRTAGRVVASLFDGSASVDLRLTRSAWVLRGGVGFRGGYAVLDGIPANDAFKRGSIGGALWGPQLAVGASWHPLVWLSFGIGAEGGVWAQRLEGLVVDETPVRIDGLFASLWGSAGVRW